MKALTILQPFTSLIALSEKTFETRGWKTKYTGELYIHAGKGKQYLDLCDEEPFKSVLAKYGLNKDNLPMGDIIAKTNLKECIPMKKFNHDRTKCTLVRESHPRIYVEGNEIAFGDWDYGRYAWLLQDTEMLKNPIPCKGQQRLWNFYEESGDFIDEKCPKCSSPLLGNNLGEKWCSNVECDYGLE